MGELQENSLSLNAFSRSSVKCVTLSGGLENSVLVVLTGKTEVGQL